jgi:hypothetical protein
MLWTILGKYNRVLSNISNLFYSNLDKFISVLEWGRLQDCLIPSIDKNIGHKLIRRASMLCKKF